MSASTHPFPNAAALVRDSFIDLVDLYTEGLYSTAEEKLLTDPVMYYGRVLDASTRPYARSTLMRNVGRAIEFFRPADGQPQPVLLDVGCGLGMNSLIFARLGFSVVGVDLKPDVVALATKQRALFEARWQCPLAAEFVAADFHAYAASAPSGVFDRVFSMSAFAHIAPLAKTVGAIARLTSASRAKVFLWDINRLAARSPVPTLEAVQREFAAAGFRRQFAAGGTVLPRQVWRLPLAFHPAVRVADELLCRFPSLAFTYVCELSR